MQHLLTHITGLDLALAMLLLIVYIWQQQPARVAPPGGREADHQCELPPPTGH